MSIEWKPGDRVQINPDGPFDYKSPWQARVAKGLHGTVTGKGRHGYNVQFDVPARVKWADDWRWCAVRPAELIPSETPAPEDQPRR